MTGHATLPVRPTFWQRRYLLRHFGRFDDRVLARATGLKVVVVRQFLGREKAVRTAAQERHIAKSDASTSVPPFRTPRDVWRLATRLQSRPLDRHDALLLGALFVASLVLYASTAARTVTGEDAGELLAAAHGLGVPHPPGYPLWTLLGHAFDQLIPWGTAAWRITLVSSVFSALANTLLLALCLKTIRHRVAAFAGAALFTVSLNHWRQAAIPEVYGLNTFFVTACALLLVRLAERPCAKRLLALVAVVGLSCTNHTSAFPAGLVMLVAAAFVAPQLWRRPRVVAAAVLVGVAPLALYVYLPWASGRDPYLDWGNTESWQAFWTHVSRQQYAVHEGTATTYAEYLQRLGLLAGSLAEQFGSPWVLGLAVVGFYSLLFRQTGVWLVLVALGWLLSIGLTQYASYRLDREHVYSNLVFSIPAWITVAWLIAGGLDACLRAAGERISRPRVLRALAAGLALVLVLPVALANGPRADRSGTTLIADYGKALLDSMDEGALFFPASDHSTFAVMYWQGVEGYRTDVVLADKYGSIDPELVDTYGHGALAGARAGQSAKEHRRLLERQLIEGWPGAVYFANRRDMSDLPGRVQEPVGPLFRVMTPAESDAWWQAGDEQGSKAPGLAFWDRLADLPLDDPAQGPDITVEMVRSDLLHMLGSAQMRAGDLEAASATWGRLRADLAPLKQTYNNIASALAEQGLLEQAGAYYEHALSEDPDYVMALRNHAIVQRDLGQINEAIASLTHVVQLEPDRRDTRLELAQLLTRAERPLAALAAYEALAVRFPRDATPWAKAGALLQDRGDLDKAEDAYAKALRLQPNHPGVALALQRLRKGIPRLLADVPALPGATEPAALGPWAALDDVDAAFSPAQPVPPSPQLPTDRAGGLIPGAPMPPDPTRGLAPRGTVPVPGGQR